MAKIIWVFYVSKIVEFIDTVIMVLKKNNRQVSFLHVYHVRFGGRLSSLQILNFLYLRSQSTSPSLRSGGS